MKDPGKPGAGKPHARFDEGGLETERPSWDRRACTATAWTAPDDHRHRASSLLYNAATTNCGFPVNLVVGEQQAKNDGDATKSR